MWASRRSSPGWTMATQNGEVVTLHPPLVEQVRGVSISSFLPHNRCLQFALPLASKMHSFTAFKETIILIDGKRVKLQLWDTSGQGRFCTIIRSYSRGAQGILLVYDITNKWSFEGIDRWRKEVDQVGNQEYLI